MHTVGWMDEWMDGQVGRKTDRVGGYIDIKNYITSIDYKTLKM